MTVYLLYYDTDYGSREEWNTFYTPCEVFATEEQRQRRIDFIKANSEEYTDDDHFCLKELEIMTVEMINKWEED